MKQKYNSCEICDKLLRKGMLLNRHVKCQKKLEYFVKNNICILCKNKATEPVMVNVFCKKHFRQIDNLKSYIYRPKTASLQNAIDYFMPKGEFKNNTAGYLMPDGVFYEVGDEHFDVVKDASYSISRNDEPTMEWFLKETGAVRVSNMSKQYAFEYYNITSIQLNAIKKFLCYCRTGDSIEIESHDHKSDKYLKRYIENKIDCNVYLF